GDRYRKGEGVGAGLRDLDRGPGTYFDHSHEAVRRTAPTIELHRLIEQESASILRPVWIYREMEPARQPRQELCRTRPGVEVLLEVVLPPLERLPDRLEDEEQTSEKFVLLEHRGEVLEIAACRIGGPRRRQGGAGPRGGGDLLRAFGRSRWGRWRLHRYFREERLSRSVGCKAQDIWTDSDIGAYLQDHRLIGRESN